MEIKQIGKEEANKYNEDIKILLTDVLKKNKIKGMNVETIYSNMLMYIEDNSAIIIGAFDDEELLGFIWAYKIQKNRETRYHINYFIVKEECRKNGVGTKLINEIYKMAKKNKIEKIELIVTEENNEAKNFYSKQNFKFERILLCKEI